MRISQSSQLLNLLGHYFNRKLGQCPFPFLLWYNPELMAVSGKRKIGNEVLKGFVEVSLVKITLLDFSSFLSPTFSSLTPFAKPSWKETQKATFNSFLSFLSFFLFFFPSSEWSLIVEIKVLNRQQSLLTNSRLPLTYTVLITFEVFTNYMVNLYRAKGGGRVGAEPEQLSLVEKEKPVMEKHKIC